MNTQVPSAHAVRFETDRATADAVEQGLDRSEMDFGVEYDYPRNRAAFVLHSRTRAQARARAERLRVDLEAWTGRSGWTPTVEPVAEQDWSESWKAGFRTEKVSARFVIKPSWETYCAAADEQVIEMDPGMSFGTGRHFTTVSCLRLMEDEHPPPATRHGFLDIGCGSGILSIAAVKLGHAPVLAIDHDPAAIETARANLRRNGIQVGTNASVDCRAADLARDPIPGRFGQVVANMLAHILVDQVSAIAGALARAPEACLILAGMLRDQYPRVKALYEAQGLCETRTLTDGEWMSVAFKPLNPLSVSR